VTDESAAAGLAVSPAVSSPTRGAAAAGAAEAGTVEVGASGTTIHITM
jgi:hypothetical protein